MSDAPGSTAPPPDSSAPSVPQVTPGLAIRGALGGVLMGLANLVPGISGGTMLLAAGVYPAFVGSIAELTMLHFRARSLVLLASVGGAAALAILLLAGPTRTLVIEQRWIMYSLFIGLTLGGVPLVWKLARPATASTWGGAAVGFGLMVLMAFTNPAGGGGDIHPALFTLGGLAGAGAMILPGVSGGYLLLVLGQYLPILGAIDTLKEAIASGLDMDLLLQALTVVVPVGIGVVVGVVGVSHALRWALHRFPKATFGVLMGLLLGAVVGLWPFQEGRPPALGERLEGRVVTKELLAELEPEDYPLVRFAPTAGQFASALALVGVGLGATLMIGRLGGAEDAE
jgi:putative membrane protein